MGYVHRSFPSAAMSQARLETLAKHAATKEEEARVRYRRWLKRAKTEDVSSIAALRCIYLSGECL